VRGKAQQPQNKKVQIMGKLTLILGGARSGKSTYAEKMAAEDGGNVVYIATAEAKDDEMVARIKKHQAERPLSWQTREIPINISATLAENPITADVVLLDCLTLLVTNILMGMNPDLDELDEAGSETAVSSEISALITTIQQSDAHWLIVSNEVGLGLVPPYPIGRLYRDTLGRANQQIAQAADHVYFLVAGLPMVVKG
jgi:adenosylcobinamide kinase/adenosylcobinamide-phosphate guanylyltransferase